MAIAIEGYTYTAFLALLFQAEWLEHESFS